MRILDMLCKKLTCFITCLYFTHFVKKNTVLRRTYNYRHPNPVGLQMFATAPGIPLSAIAIIVSRILSSLANIRSVVILVSKVIFTY